jgi:esterase/lipase superfamily enzyme
MNKVSILAVVLACAGCCSLGSVLLSVQQTAQPVTSEQVGLFTLPEQVRYPHDALARLLDARREEIREQGALVLFVHGRGKHPDKAYDSGMLADMERSYGAPVIMFHWPSWTGPLNLPVRNAEAAAPFLDALLVQLESVRPDLADVRVTLLVHSMGVRLLQALVEGRSTDESGRPAAHPFLDALVLSAADVDREGHASWLENCDLARSTYVLTNPSDLSLCVLGSELGRVRLGQGLSEPPASHERATGVHYVDLDGFDAGHDDFRVSGSYVAAYIRAVVHGVAQRLFTDSLPPPMQARARAPIR